MIDQAWLRQCFPNISSLVPMGQGGQKSVFSGHHATDGDIVLKIFHLTAEVPRVLREVQAAARIISPRIPKILDVGTAQSPLGEVMWVREERIHGESLRATLSRGPLDATATMRLGLHILEALVAAEQARIVHRDVKPDNIIVNTTGSAWLLDFGLARHLDLESLTATALPFGVGTPGYAPPEQFRNRKTDIDARADLFALGVTLYESVEGTNPFRQGTRDPGEMLRRVESQVLPPITRAVDADGQFRDLVVALTRARRNHRPASTAEALAWMQEICRKENVS